MSIVHDLPMADYLSAPGYGSSQIKLAHTSIQLLRDQLDGVFRFPQTKAFSLGALAHMQLLEPDRYAECVVPHGPINERTGREYGRETQKWQDWEAMNPGMVVADPDITRMINRCPPEIRDIVGSPSARFEVSVFTPGAKCRCDILDGTVICDLKTTQDITQAERAVYKFKYWVSSAWYRRVMQAETGSPHTYRLIFCEKKPPHRWRILDLSADYVIFADAMVEKLAQRIASAEDSGDWSDGEEITEMVSLPEWMETEEDDDATL